MAFRQILVTLALIVIVVASPVEQNSTSEDVPKPQLRADDDYRLPTDIVSISGYDIVIKPDFFNGGEVITFTGEVVISGYFTTNARRLTMHAGNNLRIVSVRIDYQSGNGVTIESTERDAEREFLHINYNGNLFTSFYIRISYTATFSDDLSGFYKTFYKDGSQDRILLLTQFQPTMARRAFPCFDEPSYKATFRLTIYAPKGYGALSNTPLDKGESYWGTTETTKYVFQPTAKMSTYAFGFLLYEEDGYSPTPFGVVSQSETSIFSWGPKSDIEAGRADYSLSASAKALGVLEQYTDIPFRNFLYNMSKVDQTVIPNLRLQARANWGLISYRGDRLLIDPSEGTEADKELAEEYIANELAHMWFGNLVTPTWWHDTWLSEGFDAYFQYWVVNQLHPDWRMLERQLVEQQQKALLLDAKTTAQTLSNHVATPVQIAGKFGDFTSTKGASIVRMLSNVMGEGTLRDALRSFLTSRSYSTASAIELQTTLQNNRPANITYDMRRFLSSWTDNAGYPLVTVTRDYTLGTAEVKQERFIAMTGSNAENEYYVPLSVRQGSSIQKGLLEPGGIPTFFSGFGASGFVLLESTGYYRVNYDEQNWAQILSILKSTFITVVNEIQPLDRAQLVDDSLNLARAGVRSYANALALVECMDRETDIITWTAALPGLAFLRRMLVNDDPDGTFNTFMLHILTAVYSKVGFSNTGSHLDKILRGKVLKAVCAAGDTQCLSDASASFRSFLDNDIRPEPDLREVILCYGIQEGTAIDWTKLSQILATSDIESERAAVISGLGCSSDADTLKEYLDNSLTNEYLENNERPAVFAAVLANPIGVDVALDKLVADYNDLLSTYGEKTLANVVTDLAEYLVTNAQVQKIRTLSASHPELSELNAAYLSADANAFWVTMNAQTVVEALKSVTPVSSTSCTTLIPTRSAQTIPHTSKSTTNSSFTETPSTVQ